jgi:hypothetical protein
MAADFTYMGRDTPDHRRGRKKIILVKNSPNVDFA